MIMYLHTHTAPRFMSVVSAWTINEDDDEDTASEHDSEESVNYDSYYSTDEESVFEERIDDEELKLLRREAEPGKITPPRYRSYMPRR